MRFGGASANLKGPQVEGAAVPGCGRRMWAEPYGEGRARAGASGNEEDAVRGSGSGAGRTFPEWWGRGSAWVERTGAKTCHQQKTAGEQ